VAQIIHLDLDAFFASVEQLDHKELRGLPLAVGSLSGRGVVAAASYEARRYGVCSAMPVRQALALCPSLRVMPPRMARYRELSRDVFAVFGRYTDLIEPLSIDEAFLDVTGSKRLYGDAVDIACRIRREVRRELGLAISAGIAPNKFLAKLATDLAKPDGLREVTESEVMDFLDPLSVSRIWGVGKATAEKLGSLGIRTIAELREVDMANLKRLFGIQGEQLHRLSRGIDERRVNPESEVKSISQEVTFEQDVTDVDILWKELLRLSELVGYRLRRQGLRGATVMLKLRYGDFTTISRSSSTSDGLEEGSEIFAKAKELLRDTAAGVRPVRLIGVGVSALRRGLQAQASLFDEPRQRPLSRVMDEVWERYGKNSLMRGTLLKQPKEQGSD